MIIIIVIIVILLLIILVIMFTYILEASDLASPVLQRLLLQDYRGGSSAGEDLAPLLHMMTIMVIMRIISIVIVIMIIQVTTTYD